MVEEKSVLVVGSELKVCLNAGAGLGLYLKSGDCYALYTVIKKPLFQK